MATEVVYTLDALSLPADGQAWISNGVVTSVRTGDLMVKSASSFRDIDQAYRALDCWRSMGYTGAPSSPASFWREWQREAREAGRLKIRTVASANSVLARGFEPLWIDKAAKGSVSGSWHHYDLNSAFLWGGIAGPLPTKYRPFQTRDRDFIALCKGWKGRKDLPMFLRRKEVLVTGDCAGLYGLDHVEDRMIAGFAVAERSDQIMNEVTDLIAAVPADIGKRISQSYWGGWAASSFVEAVSLRGGVETSRVELKNRGRNLALATEITRRVQSTCFAAAGDALAVYVDSLLLPKKLNTGKRPGQWKHVASFPKGVYIEAPGLYHDLSAAHRTPRARWYRHSGF